MQSDLKALEFAAIQRLLEKLAHTPYGAEAARNIEPAPEPAIARRMQAAVSAARRLIERGDIPNLARLPDVRPALRQAQHAGAVLQGQALQHIRAVMQAIARLKPCLAYEPALYPASVSDLDPPADLLTQLDLALHASGQLRSDASATLKELNEQIAALRHEAEAVLKQRVGQTDLVGKVAQDKIVWQGQRAVLTVPADCVDSIRGVRRGSAAGAREQWVEPLEVVAVNNRLETLGGQQEAEQQYIRRALTDAVREHASDLERMLSALTWIDLALAAGQLSVHLNASEPVLAEDTALKLDRVYHPAMLLQFAEHHGPQPVPLTVHLDQEQPMLLITGPNTGGKTVVLKTVGLLVTMAHCGLHIPAEGDCRIGNFARAIVGIGDPQSLYHHLSTFAGHVDLLKRLLADADARTLVLLDELGTGTDPEEGAALAMAVLDELARRDVRGIITTHLSPLKSYAEGHARLRNACMHFDQERLEPTYELKLGTTGRSLGLIIAGQRGLPAALLENAREHLRKMALIKSAARDDSDQP